MFECFVILTDITFKLGMELAVFNSMYMFYVI